MRDICGRLFWVVGAARVLYQHHRIMKNRLSHYYYVHDYICTFNVTMKISMYDYSIDLGNDE